MRILLLSSYPVVDRLPYKVRILEGLLTRGCDVSIAYSGVHPTDYLREARRRGLLRPTAVRSMKSGGATIDHAVRLSELAAARGVETVSFRRLDGPEALSFVRAFHPEHTINLSGLYIPGSFLAAANHRVVGAHYGDLPRFRGR